VRPHAEIKCAMAFRRFMLRGLAKARGEMGSRVHGLQPAAAARIRSRVRLTRAGEAAPPARGAE